MLCTSGCVGRAEAGISWAINLATQNGIGAILPSALELSGDEVAYLGKLVVLVLVTFSPHLPISFLPSSLETYFHVAPVCSVHPHSMTFNSLALTTSRKQMSAENLELLRNVFSLLAQACAKQ